MATFVLIHGSWHGGWCFDEVKARLEALGHEVIAPDLPGMGGSVAELRAVTLQGWADFTAVRPSRFIGCALKRPDQALRHILGHIQGPEDLAKLAAAAMIAMAPVILIGLFAQRHIVKGLTVGAVKGGGRR